MVCGRTLFKPVRVLLVWVIDRCNQRHSDKADSSSPDMNMLYLVVARAGSHKYSWGYSSVISVINTIWCHQL
jgi:hypothetical protein